MKGDLGLWLLQHYYETEAGAISGIRIEDKNCLRELCRALAIPCEQAYDSADVEKKRERLKEIGADEAVIKEAHLAAFDQEEMAALLNSGEDKIYLCEESFSIPLSKPDIHYIVIGGAEIENIAAAGQYKKNGIVVEGYEMPQGVQSAGAEQGLTLGGEKDAHTPLARAYCRAWEGCCDPYVKPFARGNAFKRFDSRHECEKAMNHSIEKAYHEAEKYLNTEYSSCVAKTARDYYSQRIQGACEPTLSSLESLSKITGKDSSFQKFRSMVNHCRKELYKKFETILFDNRSYYSLSGMDYYQGRVEVEKIDNRFSEEGVFRFIEGLVTDSIQYHIPDLLSVTDEMNDDVRRLAREFGRDSKREYDDYISEMAALLDDIGAGLPEFEEDEDIKGYLNRVCIGYAAGKYEAA